MRKRLNIRLEVHLMLKMIKWWQKKLFLSFILKEEELSIVADVIVTKAEAEEAEEDVPVEMKQDKIIEEEINIEEAVSAIIEASRQL
jgi:hypothetical protein